MSFSFRNIFSPDEENYEGDSSGGQPSGAKAAAGAGRNNPGHLNPGLGDGGRHFQSFLVGELLAFIPTAISAHSGIPMEKEVEIPMPGDGSRDVKLSTLYQMCPELFAAEITPLNDSTVTLPPKLGAMSPIQTQSADFDSVAPLRKPSPGFGPGTAHAAGETAPGNPFWAPPQKSDEGGVPVKKGDMKDEQPLSRQDSVSKWPKEPLGTANPFSNENPPHSPSMPASTEFFGGFSSIESPKRSTETGGRGVPPVKNEGSDSKRQPFSGNPFESEQGFTTLFSKQADADFDLPFPTGEVSGNKTEEPKGVWGAMFNGGGHAPDVPGIEKEDTLFTPPSFESIGNLLKQGQNGFEAPRSEEVPGRPEVESPPAFSPVSLLNQMPPAQGFAAFDPAPPLTPAPAPVTETKALHVSWTAEPKAMPQPKAMAAENPVGIRESETTPEPPATPEPRLGDADFSSVGQTPDFSGDETESSQPVTAALPDPIGEPVTAALPDPIGEPLVVANRTPGSISKPATPVSMGDSGIDDRDLVLRAMFSLSEPFSLPMVARCVVDLPGIISCSITTPGKLVQASRSEEGRIGSEAREMITTLRNLAKLTGLPEARTFTLHTDRGIVSLFLEGDFCVTVHHTAASFQPGVREKLILVARNLIKLEE